MPKDEFDFEDPFELNGMAFLSHEDTTNEMAECFTEEFMRMGYNHQQVLALFRNPHYLGPHMAFEKRGEPFIRELIADVFAHWGKAVTWPVVNAESPGVPRVESGIAPDSRPTQTLSANNLMTISFRRDTENSTPETCAPPETDHDETLTDPMGSPIPKLNV